MSQNSNQDSTIKTLGIVSLAVIVFALLYNSLLGGRNGFGFHMSYGYEPGGFPDVNGIFASLLVLAVKLLWLVFVAALLAGLVMLVKKYLNENKIDLSFISKVSQAGFNCPLCGAGVSSEFKYCPNCQASLKDTCFECGRDLLPGWKCCPTCGKEKKAAVPEQA